MTFTLAGSSGSSELLRIETLERLAEYADNIGSSGSLELLRIETSMVVAGHSTCLGSSGSSELLRIERRKEKMIEKQYPLCIKVWGQRACFTNPAFKVERVSYEIITPSAARGVLSSIFWKPEFEWRIRKIYVLKPIRYFTLTRNEIKHPIVVSSTMKWSKEGGNYFIEDHRTQRHMLGLQDVAYVISADIALQPHANADISKYRDQFRRAVSSGRCFQTPCLGLREFTASFGEPNKNDVPLDITMDLGTMLFDFVYSGNKAKPSFFHAKLEHGILTVPEYLGGTKDVS